MRFEQPLQFERAIADAPPAVSIVMPCLNEVQCLPHCIGNAREALARIEAEYGLDGEIVIADNGSTDGGQALAESLGARVVPVAARGYGAALIGGAEAAFGRYILMGDADGSYDFTDGVEMIGRLHGGAELCMGSRFLGGIAPGAMPWKNRYIGNPVLTGILNLLFRSGIGDAHCGLRAIRKESFLSLRLTGTGMEFASEMVIKAALRKLRIEEVPAKLLADLRNRAPHLRPWRDGWRHLRYLLMLSPTGLFSIPAAIGASLAFSIFALALYQSLTGSRELIGDTWTILGGALLGISHLAAMLALAGNLYGLREGYRTVERPSRLMQIMSLETMLIGGTGLIAAGGILLGWIFLSWTERDFSPAESVMPAVVGTLFVTLGVQNIFGGFLLAIIGGNEARFYVRTAAAPARDNDAAARPATSQLETMPAIRSVSASVAR